MNNKVKKNLALDLATQLASHNSNGALVEKLRNELAIDENQSIYFADAGKSKEGVVEGGRIGIWEPKTDASGQVVYERNFKYATKFNLWSKVHQFKKNKSRFRIVLIGESVARGFLYDPLYTPAQVLQSLLCHHLGPNAVEVVDLARTNLQGDEMVDLYKASCESLNPDLVIIWAGNNWKNDVDFRDEDYDGIIDSLDSSDRFSRIYDILKNRYEEKVTERVRQVNEVRKTGCPVLFLIPEINLKDWHVSAKDRIVAWPNGNTGKWVDLKERIEDAFACQDLVSAEMLCHTLVECDQFNPMGYDYLAKCALARGDWKKAKEQFVKSKQMAFFQLHGVPQCLSVTRNKLAKECRKSGVPVINLSEALYDAFDVKVAGKELFVDYCHHSTLGIQMVMSIAAEYTLNRFFSINIPARQLKPACIEPTDKVEAVANFLAALHSSHKAEQPFELLYHYSCRALEHSMEVKDIMLNFIDYITRRKPWFLSKSYMDFITHDLLTHYVMLFGQPEPGFKLLDTVLVQAFIEALKIKGIDVQKQYSQLLLQEHEPVRKVNLLESVFTQRSMQRVSEAFAPIFEADRNYYKAEDFESRFIVVADGRYDHTVDIVLRTPFEDQNDKVRILINGEEISVLPGKAGWKDYSIKLPGVQLSGSGLNILTVQWPFLDEKVERLRRKYKQQYPSKLEYVFRLMTPCYGEIASMVLRKTSLNTSGKLNMAVTSEVHEYSNEGIY